MPSSPSVMMLLGHVADCGCPACAVPRESLEARFWARVQQGEQCWPWIGKTTSDGYGAFDIVRTPVRIVIRAARMALALSGVALGDLNACHHCDNPICTRPDHLFPGTQADNLRDMDAKGRRSYGSRRTRCSAGHPLTDANVLIRQSGSGGKYRCCGVCVVLKQGKGLPNKECPVCHRLFRNPLLHMVRLHGVEALKRAPKEQTDLLEQEELEGAGV